MENNMIIMPQNKQIVGIDGKVLTVDGADASKLQLNNAFTSVRNVTASCFSIQKTIFNSVTPKPDWYDGLNAKFIKVKEYADTWNNSYASAVTSVIPSTVINFVPLFSECSGYISKVLSGQTSSIDNINNTQISNIKDAITMLIDNVEDISNNVGKYAHVNNTTGITEGLLVDWQTGMQNASLELAQGNSTVQTAIASLSNDIADLQNDIELLYKKIEHYNTLISTGVGMVGGGVFVALVGGSICLAFPVAGAITLFVGIGTFIAGTTVWAVYQKYINDARKTIREHLSKIDEDNKTMASINLLAGSCSSVVNYANSAVESLSKFTDSWDVFSDSLKKTLYFLNGVDQSAKESAFRALINLRSANGTWAKVNDYANQLLEAPKEVKVVNADKIESVA